MTNFESHRGYSAMFKQGQLTLGLFFPIKCNQGAVPEMDIASQVRFARPAATRANQRPGRSSVSEAEDSTAIAVASGPRQTACAQLQAARV